MKTKHDIDIKCGIAYCKILKRKSFLKNKKVANWKLRNLRNLGNLGNIIPSSFIFEFSILLYSQNRKLGFKNLGKKFPRFPSFWPDVPTTPWLRLQQKAEWVIINFERRNRDAPQKSHPSPDGFGEIFTRN